LTSSDDAKDLERIAKILERDWRVEFGTPILTRS
jgi:hypothetical protein